MDLFKKLLAKHSNTFQQDKNYTLILRLKHTVLKFGLKKLNISYSKISFADVRKKLSLETLEETEQIIAKAIRDGVIDAILDHESQVMRSRDTHDIYTSNDP